DDDLFSFPGSLQVVGQSVLQLPNAHRAHVSPPSIVAIVATKAARVQQGRSDLFTTPRIDGRRLRRRGWSCWLWGSSARRIVPHRDRGVQWRRDALDAQPEG